MTDSLAHRLIHAWETDPGFVELSKSLYGEEVTAQDIAEVIGISKQTVNVKAYTRDGGEKVKAHTRGNGKKSSGGSKSKTGYTKDEKKIMDKKPLDGPNRAKGFHRDGTLSHAERAALGFGAALAAWGIGRSLNSGSRRLGEASEKLAHRADVNMLTDGIVDTKSLNRSTALRRVQRPVESANQALNTPLAQRSLDFNTMTPKQQFATGVGLLGNQRMGQRGPFRLSPVNTSLNPNGNINLSVTPLSAATAGATWYGMHHLTAGDRQEQYDLNSKYHGVRGKMNPRDERLAMMKDAVDQDRKARLRKAYSAAISKGYDRLDAARLALEFDARVEKHFPESERYSDISKSADSEVVWEGEISKVSEDKQQVFGWASIAEIDGKPVLDLQGDMITPTEIEKAAYTYVKEQRVGGDMHRRISKGDAPFHASDLIESMVFTPEKIEKMGLPPGSVPTGWWVGFQVNDPEVWSAIKKGDRQGFSIHGKGRRVAKTVEAGTFKKSYDGREYLIKEAYETSDDPQEFQKNLDEIASALSEQGMTEDAEFFSTLSKSL